MIKEWLEEYKPKNNLQAEQALLSINCYSGKKQC
jgi:hypothetical protein